MKSIKPLYRVQQALLLFSVGLLSLQVHASTEGYTADQELTKEIVEAHIKRAKQYIKEHGKEAAFKEFSAVPSSFTVGHLNIFAYDFDGVCLAHPTKQALIGKNLYRLKDAKGNEIIANFIKIAKEKGAGWSTYNWNHPDQPGFVGIKHGYVEAADGGEQYFLGSGLWEPVS